MNLLYLLYYIIKADYSFVRNQIEKIEGSNKIKIYLDIIYCTLRYGGSFEDYFIYDFYYKTHNERKKYVLTGLAHHFFNKMNNSKDKEIFRDKAIFDSKFNEFIKRDTVIIKAVSEEQFLKWCTNKEEVIVKPIDGVQGQGISKHSLKTLKDKEGLYNQFKCKEYLIEEVILQHNKLHELNPTSVNSIRAITINIDGNPRLIAAILRIGRGALVDNFTEGGIAAPINLDDGTIFRGAITRENDFVYDSHPNTGVEIVGFKIPNWNQLKETVISAAKIVPTVRTVGWDLAITEEGIEIIEGNDNWNKNIYQITYGYGKKEEIKNILKELK